MVHFQNKKKRELSSSVVEFLTRDQEVAGSSDTGATALWSFSKTHLSKLSTFNPGRPIPI